MLERRGSSKDIWNVFDSAGALQNLDFVFSDRVSVLDLGGIPNTPFVGLGKLRCAISGLLFQKMNETGFNTHYLSHDTSTATMSVKPFNIKELGVTYEASDDRILGIEIIDRRVVTSKMLKRIKSGSINQSEIEKLLTHGNDLAVDARLRPPFIECTTKYQDADVYISDTDAATLAGLTPDELEKVYVEVRRLSDFLSNFFKSSGFERNDGKTEGAWCNNRFMFADSITPDEMRLIGPDGLSYDKDPVREWFENTFPDWWAEVIEVKKLHPADRSKWPSYPKKTPPSTVTEEVIRRYHTVAKAIGAI